MVAEDDAARWSWSGGTCDDENAGVVGGGWWRGVMRGSETEDEELGELRQLLWVAGSTPAHVKGHH